MSPTSRPFCSYTWVRNLLAGYSRRQALFTLVAIVILVTLAFTNARRASSAPEGFTLTSPHLQGNQLTMKVNDEEEVTIAITDPTLGTDIKQVKHPETNDVLEITETATGVKLRARKISSQLTLTFTLQDKRQDLKVTINPRLVPARIRIAGAADLAGLTANNETPAKLRQNKPTALALEQIDGKDATDLVKLVPAAGSEDTLKVAPNNKQWVLTGSKPGAGVIEVRDRVSDEVIAKLNFKVQEATQNLQFADLNVHLKEPKPGTTPVAKPLKEVFTVHGVASTDFTPAEAIANGNITIGVSSNPSVFSITTQDIVPSSAGSGTFTVTSDTGEVRTFYVTVDPVATTISFKPALPIVIIGQTLSVIATVLDKSGQPQFGRAVKWESLNTDRLAVVADNNNVAQFIGLSATDNTPAKVRATVVDDPTITQEINVFVRGRDQVLGFEMLSIRLDLVDEQMARDLFGKKTLDDLYVAKVRLYNNLRNGSGENIGDSILVFSESLEANVALEKRCENSNRSSECSQNRGQWLPLTQCDISIIRGLTQIVPFNTASGQALPTPTASPQCLLNTPFPTPVPTPRQTSQMGAITASAQSASTTSATPTPTPKLPIPTIDPNFPGRYRPYTFEMVANTHDRRDERSARSRSLLIANSLGSLVSFVTAIAVPGPSSDLPLGLDKFQNLFIPSFEKLFPSLRESQRINLITQMMKPLEEVPYGSDITRIIFFPKKPLRGVLPGYIVRFTGVSTYNLSAEAAIIKKNVRPQ